MSGTRLFLVYSTSILKRPWPICQTCVPYVPSCLVSLIDLEWKVVAFVMGIGRRNNDLYCVRRAHVIEVPLLFQMPGVNASLNQALSQWIVVLFVTKSTPAWPSIDLLNLVPCCSREMEVFAVNHAFPFSKMLTFYRKEPFTLEASYGKNVKLPLEDGFVGKLV